MGTPVSEPRVGAVVVSYNSDPRTLAGLIERLAPQTAMQFVVDNSDDPRLRESIAAVAAGAGARLITLGRNAGIAAGHNVGVAAAREAGCDYVLLSDDDSAPSPDMVPRLVAGLRRAAHPSGHRPDAGTAPVAAVGPLVFDSREPASILVFRDTPLGPRRAALQVGDPTPLPVAFLVASGCLIDVKAWQAIGPMREDLFIDHVDLEWGVRARRAGWSLFAIGDALLEHRLGDRVIRPWFLGGRVVHLHSPRRNYYLARNTVLLMRGDSLPAGWRVGYLIWLTKYVAFNLIFVAPRLARLRSFVRAISDGLAGRGGAMPIE